MNADVPPYMLADGVPATVRGVNVVGLRRSGMTPADRRSLQDAYRVLYREGLAPGTALERIRQDVRPTTPVGRLVEFVAASRRGVCGPPRRRAGGRVDDGEEGVE